MPRNLTIDVPPADKPQPWRVFGDGKTCTFCGSNQVAATCGCPDPTGSPGIFNIGVCSACLADTIMTRFSTVFHERIAKLGFDMRDAAGEIKDARRRASEEQYERGFARYRVGLKPEHDPEVEAAAARRLAEEEAAIARRYDMPPGWAVEEDDKAFAKALQKARERR